MFQSIKQTKIYREIIQYRDERITHAQFSCKYAESLRKLKNIHSGERCFLIGNGPSLQPADLDRLQNEKAFASNYIYRMYAHTLWRPTYYLNSDLGVLKNMKDEAAFWNSEAQKCFFQYNSRFVLNDDYPDNSICFYLREAEKYWKKPKFSHDVGNEVFDASTVTYIMFQLACYMGFREIYLLGIDHNYSTTINLNGVVNKHTVKDHFYSSNKNSDFDGGATANLQRMELGYLAAKEYAKKHGIKIYNATRGGKLEIFDRICFDDIFVAKEV